MEVYLKEYHVIVPFKKEFKEFKSIASGSHKFDGVNPKYLNEYLKKHHTEASKKFKIDEPIRVSEKPKEDKSKKDL